MVDFAAWCRCSQRIPGLLLAVSLSALGCSDRETVTGQLVVSIETDVALPDQVDSIRLEVLHRGNLHFGNTYEVGKSAHLIPATLTLLAGSDKAAPVTIRMIGKKGARSRTLRETITTIPQNRAASLRMPIQWLCDDRVEDTKDGVVSTCDEGFTCSGGRCIEQEVPEPTLPEYTPEDVFGGGTVPSEGSCFDTVGCMQVGSIAAPDEECTIQAPTGQDDVNVALRVIDDGICDAGNKSCFVPLDGNSDDGWRKVSNRITLPLAVCDRMTSGRVKAVVVSTACATKTQSTPPCGAWSSVPTQGDMTPGEGMMRPAPSLIASTASDSASLCCALHADANQFYTCRCDGSNEVELVAVGSSGGEPQARASFGISAPRNTVASALDGKTLFYTDRGTSGEYSVRSLSLESGESSLLASINADIFDDSPLLVDATSVYALASRVGDEGSAVQLVAVNRDSGEVKTLGVGTKAVLGFSQDDKALYVISHTDSGEAASLARQSRVERIGKSDGVRKTLATLTLQGEGADRGGFVGMLLDGDSILALSRAPAADETDEVKLVSIDSQGRQKVVYSSTVDAGRAKFSILGATEQAVLLARYALSSSSADASVQSGTVLIVPRDGSLAVISAEFLRDAPASSLSAPAFDPDGIYWVNSSGRLYRLPLAAVR